MEGFAERKAEKLVRVNVVWGERIERITISGDFFLHPEESLEWIEEEITGLQLAELDTISGRVAALAEGRGITFMGITPQVIEEAVKEAVAHGMARDRP